MNTRISVMVGLAVLVAFALPAHADTTIKSDDASVEITVPNGWRQTKPRSPAIQIQVTNGRAAVFVRVASKEDYKDLKSFAEVASSRITKNFTDAEPKFEDVPVNGKPAIRVSATGTQSNGMRRGYVMTFVDTDGKFVEVVGITGASAFQAEQQSMADMAGRVKVLAAAGAGPTAQMPAATPPAGNTPPATPPGRQPPTGRQPR
jgi:hypothetical protein